MTNLRFARRAVLGFLLAVIHVCGQPSEVALRKCVPGMDCLVYVLSAFSSPQLMVVREDHVCGSPPDAQFQAQNPAPGMPSGNGSLFSFGVLGPSPGLFRLCICDPCGSSAPSMFTGDVGDLLVPGPVGATQRPAVCTAGGPVCTVNVTALGMHPGRKDERARH